MRPFALQWMSSQTRQKPNCGVRNRPTSATPYNLPLFVFSCPFDRIESAVPNGVDSDLPPNRLLMEHIQSSDEAVASAASSAGFSASTVLSLFRILHLPLDTILLALPSDLCNNCCSHKPTAACVSPGCEDKLCEECFQKLHQGMSAHILTKHRKVSACAHF
jgi:hypothetical protein